MDAIKTDALGKDVGHCALDGGKSGEKPDEKRKKLEVGMMERKSSREESDDLLEKIEAVVKDKDKESNDMTENDISESSEQDFIKKIEEMEDDASDTVVLCNVKIDVSATEKSDKSGKISGNNEASGIVDAKVACKEKSDNVHVDGNHGGSSDTSAATSKVHAQITENGNGDDDADCVIVSDSESELKDTTTDTESVTEKISEEVRSTIKDSDAKKEIKNIESKCTEQIKKSVINDANVTEPLNKQTKQLVAVEKGEEPMLVDSVLTEQMDVDSDEKMEVDQDDEKVLINDEEMLSVGESTSAEDVQKQSTVNVEKEQHIPVAETADSSSKSETATKESTNSASTAKITVAENAKSDDNSLKNIEKVSVKSPTVSLNVVEKESKSEVISAKVRNEKIKNTGSCKDSKEGQNIKKDHLVKRDEQKTENSNKRVESAIEISERKSSDDSDVEIIETIDSKGVKFSNLPPAGDIKSKQRDETSSPKKDESVREEASEVAPKIKTLRIQLPVEAKDSFSSDSTASLTSATDDHIIKFSLETTVPTADLEADQISKKLENKPLTNLLKHGGSSLSLNTTPVSSANVFNSTPIQKQFEISSENVSKISEVAELSGTGKKFEEEVNSTKTEKPETSSDTGTCTSGDHQTSTDTQSSGNQSSVTKYMNVITKYNGITDLPMADESGISGKGSHSIGIGLLSSLGSSDMKTDSLYDVNIWYEKNDLIHLFIEKREPKKLSTILLDKTSSEPSDQASSSNGSVTSLPPYSLPGTRLSELTTSSSGSQRNIGEPKPSTSAQIRKNKVTIKGISDLCNFMIDEFTKIKRNLHSEEGTPSDANIPKEVHRAEDPTTPKSVSRELTKKNIAKDKTSPSISEMTPSPRVRNRKRSFNKSQSEEEDEGKPKAKQSKKSISKSQGTPSKEIEIASQCDLFGQYVLARWVDKKYYAGRITAEKPGNKFVVLFEDGASKTLPRDSIVFGDGDYLPLKDRIVYALVDDDYECGVVESVEKVDENVFYTVKSETRTVRVTASDIYLQDDQAKAIQGIQNAQKKLSSCSPDELAAGPRSTRNKRASASPVIPEAGYSGGVGKKVSKRQKRGKLAQSRLKRISESSDLSDTQESLPSKLETSLEWIEGVQPELQKTEKEAELCKMIFFADYYDHQPNSNPQEMLGPLPNSRTLFRNKCFLLTCSVGLKPHRYVENDTANVNSKNRQFSKIPFVKHYLQKQIENGGGTVYNHFQDVPKSKYRFCKLLAPRPCTTAKFLQCLSADIQPVSHEWIIDSCNKNILQDVRKYVLPSGWSMITEKFVRWPVGKSPDQRQSNQIFAKTIILLASRQNDFITYWTRICKLSGATIRYIKRVADVTASTKGYMVIDLDCSPEITAKAAHFGIPIVSTVWIVQSLILGMILQPDAHPKLKQMYPDDDD